MISFFNFQRKYQRYKSEIDTALARVFERGWFILGPEGVEFENAFARYLDAKYVIGVNSGTDAIFLSLSAAGVSSGDEVITVANTAVPTISAIRLTGATPVFVDVTPDAHTLDPELLEKAITTRTRAIVPVHLYGYPSRMQEILEIAERNGIPVIEDACQSHGAKYDGKALGTLGLAGCFSFYPTKNLGAFGDAGAIATSDRAFAEKVIAMRNYGEVAKFKNEFEGVNSRMDELQAAVLLWSLRELDGWNARRSELARFYIKELSDVPVHLPIESDDLHERVWHLFVIKSEKRDELQKFLRDRGIDTMIHYPTPIPDQPAYHSLRERNADLPVTSKLAKQILSLPLYPELTFDEISEICRQIRAFYES